MILSALTFEEILDPTNMSHWRLCVEDEAFSLPLDIDRFPNRCEESIYGPLVFVLCWFIILDAHVRRAKASRRWLCSVTALCQRKGFQKRFSCHFRTGRRHLDIHAVSQLLSISSALLNGQTWFARSGTGVSELGSPAGSQIYAVIGH